MTPAETYLASEGVFPGCRWSAARKFAVVVALHRHPDERDDILRAHEISDEEFDGWRRNVDIAGADGLMATKPPSRVDRSEPPDQAAASPGAQALQSQTGVSSCD